jgi:hypothetical protein
MLAIGSLGEFEESITELLEIASPHLQGEEVRVMHSEMRLSDFSVWVFAATATRGLVLHLDGMTDLEQLQPVEHFGPFPISDIRDISNDGPEGITCIVLEDDVFIPSGQVSMGKTKSEFLEELKGAIKSLSS